MRLFPGVEKMTLYPVYNMMAPPNEAAVLGFVVHEPISGNIVVSVEPDYGVHAHTTNVITGVELIHQMLTIWGAPADPPPRFDPSFAVNALSNQAGGYSTLRVTFGREDTDEDLGGSNGALPTMKDAILFQVSRSTSRKLAMPTEFLSQANSVIRRSTPIAVVGCSRAGHHKAHRGLHKK